jgi:hypothetical protein
MNLFGHDAPRLVRCGKRRPAFVASAAALCDSYSRQRSTNMFFVGRRVTLAESRYIGPGSLCDSDLKVRRIEVSFAKHAADSKEWEGKPDKFQYFSPNPGAGD